MFWISVKFNGHCHYFNFNLSSHIILGTNKTNIRIIMLFIPHFKKGRHNLWLTISCHFQTWTPSTSSMVGHFEWHNPSLLNFLKIWKIIFLLWASKMNWGIKIKFKIFWVFITSLNFKMVYYIMMGFYMHLMAMFNFKFFKASWHVGCMTFWIQQHHIINVLKSMVITTFEVWEKNCWFMWCLGTNKKSL